MMIIVITETAAVVFAMEMIALSCGGSHFLEYVLSVSNFQGHKPSGVVVFYCTVRAGL